MKNIVWFIFAMVLGVQAQYKIEDGSELLNLQKLPLEKMYVHASSPLLFSGEYLYYKLYNINAQTNKLSNISSVGYAELVNQEGESVFRHKIRLQKGMGQGDFFVDTSIPSGNYKLVGYTQWMKNGGLQQVYKDDLAIINPYRTDQSDILKNEGQSFRGSQPSANSHIVDNPKDKAGAALLQLQLDTTIFSHRTEIQLTIRNYKGPLGHGQYSVAVRKQGQLSEPPRLSAEAYSQDYLSVNKKISQGVGDSIFLPEQRGELVFGKVLNSTSGLPAAKKKVVISVPGKEYILKAASTDEEGNFFTYLRKEYKTPETIFQVVDAGEYDITVGEQSSLPYQNMDFQSFVIYESNADAIRKRSVRNQIENAYFSVKPDSVLALDKIDPFDGGIPEIFELNDYTRFPTFQETLIEILNTVGYRKNKDGDDYIRVLQDFEAFNEPYNDYPAIVLIDGVFIPDHSKIKEFNANRIQRIKVVRDQLVLGGKQYQGIVSVETKNGDYFQSYSNENMIADALQMPRPIKNYFQQKYMQETAGDEKRIPDYRSLLLWDPDINLDGTEVELSFFTSDLRGDFEIILEGFTTYGKPVSLAKTFRVE